MPKQPEIRWRQSDLQELRRTVKNYNAKLAREREKLLANEQRYQAANLPKKASVRELRKAIETRKEFHGEISKLQNYIKTGDSFVVGKRREKSLESTVTQFNIKVDRMVAAAKKKGTHTPTAWIPEKISVEGLKKTARTPADLDRLIKDHKEFLHRGAEEIVELPDSQLNLKLTRWQYNLMSEGIAEVNKAREAEREAWKNTELKYGGKPVGYTRAQVGMDMEGEFPEMNLYTRWSTERDMHKKLNLILRERQLGYWEGRTELARINYLETLKAHLGNDPVGKILINQISKMPLEDFKRVLTENHDLFDLLYRFKEEGDASAREDILNTIWNEWNPEKDMATEIDKYIDKEIGKL